MFKKGIMALLATVILLTGGLSASASGVLRGTTTYNPCHSGCFHNEPWFISTGGNYEIQVLDHTVKSVNPGDNFGYLSISLYEYDGGGGADDFVESWTVSAGQPATITFREASAWMDEGEAEFYVRLHSNYTATTAVTMKYYD